MGTKRLLQDTWVWDRNISYAVVNCLILIPIILGTIFANYVAPHHPNQINALEAFQAPGGRRLMMRGDFGRDILSRILSGGRLCLAVGIIAVSIAATFGTTLGVCSRYMGGWVNSLISRFPGSRGSYVVR